MKTHFRRLTLVLITVALLGSTLFEPHVYAQAAQIQAALRQFLQTANTWTGTQTFNNITVGGTCTGCAGTGAPVNATYLTQTANATLTAEQAVGALASGIMRVATTTGVVTSLTTSAGIAANISDETGSGVLVFATSPTLVTPVLGAATATSVSFATGNGISFAGGGDNPTLVYGDDDGFGDTTIRFSNVADDYIALNFTQYTDLNFEQGVGIGGELSTGIINVTGSFAQSLAVVNGTPASYHPFDSSVTVTSTNKMPSDNLSTGLRTTLNFGLGGVATVGTAHSLTSDAVVYGNGNADNEITSQFASLSVNIGTGFTQTTGPTPRAWLADFDIYGPIAVQPSLLNGMTIHGQNYYNGSPADSPSALLWVVTKFGADGLFAPTIGATNYAFDVGIGIVGFAGNGITPTNGFAVGVQIGGNGSGYMESGTSLIGTGVKMRDIVSFIGDWAATEGADAVLKMAADEGDDATDAWTLKVLATGNSLTWTNNGSVLSTLTTAGVFSPVTMQPTTAYKSVDGTTGATVTTCTGYKNGLCISGT